MVEGHSVHRIAAAFRRRLVGKRFKASSPNGRFTEGAAKINGRPFARIEAVGKNLFAFFGAPDDKEAQVVVHVHFGMSGAWAVHDVDRSEGRAEPPTTATTRLRLEETPSGGASSSWLVAHLSAMTVAHGDVEGLWLKKKARRPPPFCGGSLRGS